MTNTGTSAPGFLELSREAITADGHELFLTTIPLDRERFAIGRKEDNDLRLDQATVSGHHLVVVTLLGDSFLEDLNSTNGTRVNGLPVMRHALSDGDTFQIGHYTFRYRRSSVPGETTPVLTITAGPGLGRRLPLSKAVTRVGSTGSAVVEVLHGPEGTRVQRLGTGEPAPTCNGQPLGETAQPLRIGDELQVAGVTLRLELPVPPGGAAAGAAGTTGTEPL